MSKSRIEWTDVTWNPVTGCDRVSAGCDHCYAERFAERFRGVPGHPYEQGFDVVLRPKRLAQPCGWRRPRFVFVNSMSDLFHPAVPDAYLDEVFGTMEYAAPQHLYQVLTKRSPRMRRYMSRRYARRRPPPNVWLGVSVEDSAALGRLRLLRQTPAIGRFVSFEPLLGPVGSLDLTGVHWVIAGGESGPGARPVQAEWLREIRDQCRAENVSFFFKQWGGARPKSGGRLLDGRTWDERPSAHYAWLMVGDLCS